jgi:TPP-dependent pyruvate/acetoin dehydrogenase alpha subunit
MKEETSKPAAAAPGSAAHVDKTEHERMYYFMALTRQLEDRIERKLYRQGKIVGGVYVGRGQEAIAVGSCILSRPEDVICPSHRDMAAMLIRGLAPWRIVAQYMGRRDGYSKGKDGNIHIGCMERHVIAFISMLADTVPVAAGIALSFKMRNENRVVLCYFGDGATSRGDWHEGLNLAAIHKLPVIYICNNNQYAYSTPLELQMAVRNVADRAAAYGIAGETVDGNDVLAVRESTRRAIDRARAGQGPTLLECKTFRMTGHSAHDDASYVPRELLAEWEKKDPITRHEQFLLQAGIFREEELGQLRRKIAAEVEQAIERAEKSPYPAPEDCLSGVYGEGGGA